MHDCLSLFYSIAITGTRVVLGRETSPVPVQIHSRIPQEIWNKFAGMTREVRVVFGGYPG